MEVQFEILYLYYIIVIFICTQKLRLDNGKRIKIQLIQVLDTKTMVDPDGRLLFLSSCT